MQADQINAASDFPTIILADDDEDDILIFKEALIETAAVCDLVVAKDGEKLIDALKTLPAPDLILLDVNMPLKNGFECIQEIKNLPDSSQIPVVFLSTSNNKNSIDKAKLLGAKGYITKPASFRGYQSMVTDVLSKNWKSAPLPDFYQYSEKKTSLQITEF